MATCTIVGGNFSVNNIMSAGEIPLSKIQTSFNEWSNTNNEHTKIISDTMCNWAAPEYGDEGETWERKLWQAGMIASIILNTTMQSQIAFQRYGLAKSFADISKNKWERFAYWYVPLEQSVLNEVGNEPKHNPNYNDARMRSSLLNNFINRDMESILNFKMEQYNLCPSVDLINDFILQGKINYDDTTNMNYSYEIYQSYIKEDLRRNRRTVALNLGRDIPAQQSTYGGMANSSLASLGELAGNNSQGAIKLLSYMSNINDTRYPSQFSMSAPLEGQSSMMGDYIINGYTK